MYRLCEKCGKPLPPNSSNLRKYCKECAPLVNSHKTRQNQIENQKKSYIDSFKSHPSEEDREYCKLCIYAESHSYHHLCNYILITGNRRGCKGGKDCIQRRLKSSF